MGELYSARANYQSWFSNDSWGIWEAACITCGLDPRIIKMAFEGKLELENCIEFNVNESWHPKSIYDLVSTRTRDIQDDLLTHSYYDGYVVYSDDMRLKPYYMIQFAWDMNYSFHFTLEEYLEEIGLKKKFSRNSPILNELDTYSRKEFWHLTEGARLLLGVQPYERKELLSKKYNLPRHVNPDYNMTKADEVFYIKELALDSFKAGNLNFYEENENLGLIPALSEGARYYTDDGCEALVGAKEFVEWAVKKRLNPPEQLLEFMGLNVKKPQDMPEQAPKAVQEDILRNELRIHFSEMSGKIFLNGLLLLAKPNHGSENYSFFKYLYDNPNRTVTREELTKNDIKIGKSPSQIVNDLGFKGGLGKLFFSVSENAYTFRNPITDDILEDQDFKDLRLFKK